MLLCLAVAGHAQSFNSSFEQLDSTGAIQGWTNNQFDAASDTLDERPFATSDSIRIDQAYYAPSTDAHSGLRALELRNGYNVTRQVSIPGSIDLIRMDYTYSPQAQRFFPIQYKPDAWGFFYRWLPAGPDTAWALLTVYDMNFVEIGTAEMQLVQPALSYAYVGVPVAYSASEAAAYMSIRFRTAKPEGTATYGSRLLIDDVTIEIPKTIGLEHAAAKASLVCYPTLAVTYMTVEPPAAYASVKSLWSVVDASGKTVATGPASFSGGSRFTVSVSTLPAGAYTLLVAAPGQVPLSSRFTKL